jgi:hypothetical protein
MIGIENQRTPPVIGRRRSENTEFVTCAAFIAGWRPRAGERCIRVTYYHPMRNPGLTRESADAGKR